VRLRKTIGNEIDSIERGEKGGGKKGLPVPLRKKDFKRRGFLRSSWKAPEIFGKKGKSEKEQHLSFS